MLYCYVIKLIYPLCMHKFLRHVNFVDVTNPTFSLFLFSRIANPEVKQGLQLLH